MSSKSQEFARRVLAAFSSAGLTSDKQIEDAGGPSSTWMTLARKVSSGEEEFTRLRSDSLSRIDDAARWQSGSASALWHEGTEPKPIEVRPAANEANVEQSPATSLFQIVSREAEEAQRDFERAATELAAAEARVDSANDRVFAHLALEEKFREEAKRREQELGRPLTQIEWYAIDSFDRPSELEKAQMRAAYASNDGHERTRFEIAAMVRFDEWEEETARLGSRFFDFTDAYRRVDRIIGASDELAKRRIKTSEADASMEAAALETEPGLDELPGGSEPNE